MQLYDLNNDIFNVLRCDHDIDLRILRMVARGFRMLDGGILSGHIADRIISAIIAQKFGLVEWYYVCSGRVISFSDIEQRDYRFAEFNYNRIPKYILQDHPELGVQPVYMRQYLRILGVELYYKLAIMQPAPNLNIGGRGQDALACELVHDCKNATDTYRICLLLFGHWNAPHNIVNQFAVNADHRQMTQAQVRCLHFLVLCNRHTNIIDAIMRLYKHNDATPSVELNIANMYVRGVFMSEQQYLKKMIDARNELVADGADPMVDAIFNRTVMPRIRAIDSTTIRQE